MTQAEIDLGFKMVLPYLKEIANLILDDDISEIMVNSSSDVFVERRGSLERIPDINLSQQKLKVAVQNIARGLCDDVSERKPILDSRLPDGSRIAAVMPPCSINGITLTIRKFSARAFTITELVSTGTLTQAMADCLQTAVLARKNILISGGTGSGKTTILNILTDFIPDERRILVIEDTAEIHIRKPNVVRFEARKQQGDDIPAVTIRDLLKASLRHRPDTTILGEIRGEEAFDLLQALNTGHAGSLSTIHANSAAQALSRLASCVLQSNMDMPYKAIKANIGDSIQILLHAERRHAKRYVTEIVQLDGYDPTSDTYKLTPLFTREESN